MLGQISTSFLKRWRELAQMLHDPSSRLLGQPLNIGDKLVHVVRCRLPSHEARRWQSYWRQLELVERE